MRPVPTPVASQLSCLSIEKLREWTSRHALVAADVLPGQKGEPAQFSCADHLGAAFSGATALPFRHQASISPQKICEAAQAALVCFVDRTMGSTHSANGKRSMNHALFLRG